MSYRHRRTKMWRSTPIERVHNKIELMREKARHHSYLNQRQQKLSAHLKRVRQQLRQSKNSPHPK